MIVRVVDVAARSRATGAEEVVFGAVFALVGSALLFFRRRVRDHYRAISIHAPIVFLSAYILPTVFAITGVAMIVGGVAMIVRGE